MTVIALIVSLVVTVGMATVTTASSASAAPTARPGPPTKVSAAAGNGQATVSFSPPSATGGTPITFYTVTATNQADQGASPVQVVGKTSPIIVKGMVNGVVWTITVAATNAAGQGAATNSSSVVIPTNHPELTPDPPTNVTAKAAPGQATVSFTPPTKGNVNAPVYFYIATATDLTDPSKGGQTGVVDYSTGPVGSGPITVTGLTNGDLYTFTVISGNSGTNLPGEPTQGSVPSAPSAPVIPAGPPGRPTIGTAVAGNGEATVSFSASEDNGGQPIIDFRVTAVSGETASGSKSPIVVTGLSNGTSYTFAVTAVNDAGQSAPSSQSNPVIPSGNPSVPGSPTMTHATAGDGQASLSFTPPASDGSAPIIGYTVTATDLTDAARGGQSAAATASPVMVTQLTNGDRYFFQVTATNDVGTSPPSPPSNEVVPRPDHPVHEQESHLRATSTTRG